MVFPSNTIQSNYQYSVPANSQRGCSVQPTYNNNVYRNFEQFVTYYNKKSPPVEIKQIPEINYDASNDGKFSFKQAMKNYFKGLVSPVTSMFKSVKSFALGVGLMVAGIGLASIGLGPVLVAAGFAIGTLQALRAIYKGFTAENGDGVEKAFMKQVLLLQLLVFLVVGAKAALRSKNITTERFTQKKAIIDCFKQINKSTFISAWAKLKTNFANLTKSSPDLSHNAILNRTQNAEHIELLSGGPIGNWVKNPYKVLGIKRNASLEQIKSVYKNLAVQFHPDLNKSPHALDIFKEVSVAYKMLTEPYKKLVVDNTLIYKDFLTGVQGFFTQPD